MPVKRRARARGGHCALYAAARGLDDVATMQAIDLATWLPGDILVKADRMSMAHGLEVRVPFLDREVFQVAAGLSRASKIGRGTTKLAMRRALAGVIPDDAMARPKLGFPVPIRHWLAGELHDWAHQIIVGGDLGGLLDVALALELLRRHRAGDGDHSRKLWTMLVLCLWHQARRAHDVALAKTGAVA
jgi:asparagine synthase (glutamine-hydrolysing)